MIAGKRGWGPQRFALQRSREQLWPCRLAHGQLGSRRMSLRDAKFSLLTCDNSCSFEGVRRLVSPPLHRVGRFLTDCIVSRRPRLLVLEENWQDSSVAAALRWGLCDSNLFPPLSATQIFFARPFPKETQEAEMGSNESHLIRYIMKTLYFYE